MEVEMPDAVIDELVRSKLYIDGRWSDSQGSNWLDVINPSTEESLGRTVDATAEDVDLAVGAACRAFEDRAGWRSLSVAERAQKLEDLAAALEEREDAFSDLAAVETGRPIGSTRGHPSRPAEILRYYAALARTTASEELRPMPDSRTRGALMSIVRREPVGVVAAIVPYNAPVLLAMQKIAPALALGSTVVMKSPPQAPLDLYLVADAAHEVGFPEGVINVIAGGRECGEALVAHPGVDKVAFTGSTAAGRAIAATCGQLLKPVSLELGGKSAAIVLDDANLDGFTRSLGFLGFGFAGQLCFLNSRILAPRSRYDEVVDAITAFAGNLKLGDASDPVTQLGPVITSAHREHIQSLIANGIEQGARTTTGGKVPEDPERGWFIEPTVFRDVENTMRISQEEIFGPVLAVIPYDSEDDAVAKANDSLYGLAGSVWTSDVGHGIELARRIETGTIGVNGYGFNSAAPFGGRKASGLGSELGPEALHEYSVQQSIHIPA
jgi:aldehyde dehydrogenase (NAD+)